MTSSAANTTPTKIACTTLVPVAKPDQTPEWYKMKTYITTLAKMAEDKTNPYQQRAVNELAKMPKPSFFADATSHTKKLHKFNTLLAKCNKDFFDKHGYDCTASGETNEADAHKIYLMAEAIAPDANAYDSCPARAEKRKAEKEAAPAKKATPAKKPKSTTK